jgi:two-component system LytT family response regulator
MTMNDNSFQLVNVGGRKAIEAHEVIMLQAETNYTYIHLVDGTKFLVSYTLGKIAERLEAYAFFVRPNRSVLLNANYTTSFNGLFLEVSLPNGTVLKNAAISRRKKNQVFEQMTALCKV